MLALLRVPTELIVPDLKSSIADKKVTKTKKDRKAKKTKPKGKDSSSTMPDSAKTMKPNTIDATGKTERVKSGSSSKVTHSGRYQRHALSKNMRLYSDNDLAAVLCTPIANTTTTTTATGVIAALPSPLSSNGDAKSESKRERLKTEVILKKQVYD